ncbi:MAG TPA: DEAD/DEAH box helicase, partial [Rhodocyclaceae bacterium]|nr:DEAD/DEAH box helicase [Rhodocyclaceae bacterium]
MLTIRAHGVPSHSDDASGTALSPAQHRLLTDPAPIRVCGAPTGSGKTYAFLQAAKRGELVLFVVPTQALAGDIEASARDQDIPIARWDGAQSAQLRANGLEPWIERKLELEHLKRDGGMVVTTPETLGAILLGRPQQQKEPQARAQLTLVDFQQVRHIVFDEAHTLIERA